VNGCKDCAPLARDNAAMNTDLRWHSAAAERNREPIAQHLQQLLPPQGVLLEVASGTGQHAAFLSQRFSGWTWLPSDADPGARASIGAWCEGLRNVQDALTLDVMQPQWPGVPPVVDAIFCANMIHIAPWACCAGLMDGAARHLSAQGLLVLYGPYLVEGEAAAPSNLAFDADLRSRNPAWGLRALGDVLAVARQAGLHLQQRLALPANNLMLVLARARP
jgi:hypothetical protein